MNIFDILLICIGLSMDNMAVAIASFCKDKQYSFSKGFKVALSFCFIGFICLFFGWYGGTYLDKYISSWDHWLSFFILVYIGGKMILNYFKNKENSPCQNILQFKTLLLLALATNLDVFAIGLTLAFYKVSFILVLILLSLCIVMFTLLGSFLGRKLGLLFGRKAELAGGIILVIIAIKVLLQGIIIV